MILIAKLFDVCLCLESYTTNASLSIVSPSPVCAIALSYLQGCNNGFK